MFGTILSAILILCLLGTIYTISITLTRYENPKRIPFVLLQATIFLTVIGYLLEINAKSADGGFTACKLMYVGLLFLSPAFLRFAATYCEIRMNAVIKVIVYLIPTIILVLIWTTELHGLFYVSIGYESDAPLHHIVTVKGPLYPLIIIHPMLCACASIAVLLRKLITQKKSNRANITLLIAGALVPMLSYILFLFGISTYDMNYTPVSMSIVSVLYYISIIKHNLFDIVPRAKEIALKTIREAFVLVDMNKELIYANEAAEELLPVLKTAKGVRADPDQMWPFRITENDEIITPIQFNMPEDKHYNANISPLLGDKQNLQGYIIIIQDVTESVRMTHKLEEIAYTDALTGINNRQHFMSLAEAQFERVKRIKNSVYIVMFDVDLFKKINDTYGHIVGDKTLRCIADRIRNTIRPYDLFGRYGGEEFILLISDISEADIKSQVERMRTKICETPMIFDELELTVSASFGVARATITDRFEDIIDNADKALYMAKGEGRNKVVIYGGN